MHGVIDWVAWALFATSVIALLGAGARIALAPQYDPPRPTQLPYVIAGAILVGLLSSIVQLA